MEQIAVLHDFQNASQQFGDWASPRSAPHSGPEAKFVYIGPLQENQVSGAVIPRRALIPRERVASLNLRLRASHGAECPSRLLPHTSTCFRRASATGRSERSQGDQR